MDPKPEARIVVNRNPEAPGTSKLNPGRRQANREQVEQIRQRRAHIHGLAKNEVAGNRAADEARAANPAEPPPEREDIESIEVTLRNGMVIEYGPPTGISLLDRIARLYAGRDPSVSEFRLTRLLMGIRSVNGRPQPPITNEIARTELANRIGDEGIDLLFYFDRLYWPPLRTSELPEVKKKLRA